LICIRAAYLGVQGVEDAVDEGARVLRSVILSEVDGFVEGHFRGNVAAVEKLVHGKAKDVSVNPGHPFQRPVFGTAADQSVDFLPVPAGPLDEFGGVLPGLLRRAEMAPEKTDSFPRVNVEDIDLIKNL
jgi:hypothetical protein